MPANGLTCPSWTLCNWYECCPPLFLGWNLFIIGVSSVIFPVPCERDENSESRGKYTAIRRLNRIAQAQMIPRLTSTRDHTPRIASV